MDTIIEVINDKSFQDEIMPWLIVIGVCLVIVVIDTYIKVYKNLIENGSNPITALFYSIVDMIIHVIRPQEKTKASVLYLFGQLVLLLILFLGGLGILGLIMLILKLTVGS